MSGIKKNVSGYQKSTAYTLAFLSHWVGHSFWFRFRFRFRFNLLKQLTVMYGICHSGRLH